jgi:hypothetical protein
MAIYRCCYLEDARTRQALSVGSDQPALGVSQGMQRRRGDPVDAKDITPTLW